ncbi:hypothetical protein L486_00981 [Kwoniella mangroviensis CBS 10435]|uniref:Uncharacterized protein n=1 Tax=Kwoniella mangroviensis CBS 10435 TaxID=1331196 RepID=A0A1B9J0P3_9TREE|nr:hypothetical protein L486_00981 [Kwoniella mangroviensis CBS 10435]
MDDPSLSRLVVDREPEWLRVKDNVSSAMFKVMETRLATMPGGKDGESAKVMRKELEIRLKRIQEQMFDMSKYNLQVNGQNYENYVEATEGFDESLDRHIWALQVERTDWESKTAEKRKRWPEMFYSVEEDLEMRRTDVEWLPDENDGKDENKHQPQDLPPPERHEEVKETFKVVVDNLAEVAKSAPIQLQRAQRAQTVREEISSLPP